MYIHDVRQLTENNPYVLLRTEDDMVSFYERTLNFIPQNSFVNEAEELVRMGGGLGKVRPVKTR